MVVERCVRCNGPLRHDDKSGMLHCPSNFLKGWDDERHPIYYLTKKFNNGNGRWSKGGPSSKVVVK